MDKNENKFDFFNIIKTFPVRLERPWILYNHRDKHPSTDHVKSQKLLLKLGYSWFDGKKRVKDKNDKHRGLMQPNMFNQFRNDPKYNNDVDYFIFHIGEVNSFTPSRIDDYNIYYLEDIINLKNNIQENTFFDILGKDDFNPITMPNFEGCYKVDLSEIEDQNVIIGIIDKLVDDYGFVDPSDYVRENAGYLFLTIGKSGRFIGYNPKVNSYAFKNFDYTKEDVDGSFNESVCDEIPAYMFLPPYF